MSHSNQLHAPVDSYAYGYPAPPESYPPPKSAEMYVTAPPPIGYPTRDDGPHGAKPTTTQTKGDGFWKGCCAALCCCWILDCCVF